MQTRADIEFMGRMLGLRPGVHYEPCNVVLSDRPSLGTAVSLYMADTIANVRAQRNIGELLGALERIESLAEFDPPGPSPEFN
jgi:hypothetical protein